MIRKSVIITFLFCISYSYCSENNCTSNPNSVKTKRKNSLNGEKQYEVTKTTYDNNKSHFSVEITPPNSPECLARAYIKPNAHNNLSCSLKITTRPNIHVINELEQQLNAHKTSKKLTLDSWSVEFQNLSNNPEENNSELNLIMKRLISQCFDAETATN